MTVSNDEFLRAVFGPLADVAHVTAFHHDPSNIPADQHLKAWKGDYSSRWRFEPDTNQYFTISTFHADERGVARRRKALFRQTHCIVLDDVREKLSIEQAKRLPPPGWIMETSPGSEQWGYFLTEPCSDRGRVENLLDGLVANGLAPEGRDPGMKGVTRYVRLPEGINNKASKLVNGQPFKCRMLDWQPFNVTTLEALAEPFNVDLDAPRREARVDGAANVAGHPLLDLPDLIRIKEVRSDGRFDVTCPWVEEHTDAGDNGSAVFTNADGSMGFKCHHGACQGRTGNDLLTWIEQKSPGFGTRLASWKATRLLADVSEVSFLGDSVKKQNEVMETDPIAQTMKRLSHAIPNSSEQQQLAEVLLKAVDQLSPIEKESWHKQIAQQMGWSKKAFDKIIKDLRSKWYQVENVKVPEWVEGWYFVTRNDQYYNPTIGVEVSQTGFDNEYRRYLDPNDNGNRPAPHRVALDDFNMPVVRDVIYMPRLGERFELNGLTCVNRFRPSSIPTPDAVLTDEGREAIRLMDAHLRHLCDDREEVYNGLLYWLAFVAQNPGKKIRWSPIIKGIEGDGKSMLIDLLTCCLGGANITSVMPKVIVSDYNGYAEGHCVVALEEVRMVGHSRYAAMDMLKPLITNDTVDIHRKGENNYNAPNVSNYMAFTNHGDALPLSNVDRRWMVVFTPWSDAAEMEQAVGMSLPDYFTRLREAMHKHAGALAHWLTRYPLPAEFNPNAAAPVTQEKESMRVADKDDDEEKVEEAIESGGEGVGEKILSTRHLTRMMAKNTPTLTFQDVPQGRALAKILQRLGWVRYPKQVKWYAEPCQIWTHGKPMKDTGAIRAALDKTMEVRGKG